MNFDLDENQTLFRDSVERFCAPIDVATRTKMRRIDGGFDRVRWTELAELGLIGLAASESDGGLGGSILDNSVIAQALGTGLAIEPWLECGFLPARLLAGRPEIMDVISGQKLTTLAFAERGGRYSLDARKVTGRNGKLNGEKTFILSGGAADQFIVTANVSGQTQMFIVPASATGVDIRPYPIADGSLAAVVTFRDVAISDSIGGMELLSSAIDETRIMIAAEMVGCAQRLFKETLEYVKTREQFGQPLGRFQIIQHRMVDIYSKCEAIQSALYGAILKPSVNAEAIKAYIAEEAIWVGQQAVQLHGGMGMTDELAIGHGLKRILLLSKLFGDPASGISQYAKAA
jgi:alkylation response protein AidB-like acyl-CoA dehydrogenase